MVNYSNYVQFLLDNNLVSLDEIFYFEDSPYGEEFQKVFDFYLETLDLNKDYGIEPAYLYFHNDATVNARAGKSVGGIYIVGINSGTIIYLIEQYKLNDEVSNNEIASIKQYLGTDVNTLMYQFSIHFTFYHEMAHLIQKSKFLELYIDELNSVNRPYDERKHVLELDADNYASLCLGAHILDLYETNFSGSFGLNKFSALVKMTCAVGINYILSFNSNKFPFYLKESTHPHPSIRITCIIYHILEYYQLYYGKEKFNDQLKKKLKKESLEMASDLFGKEVIQNYDEIVQNNKLAIEGYLDYIFKLERNDKSLAVYKWNELISKQSE